jgi:hypothetical protein
LAVLAHLGGDAYWVAGCRSGNVPRGKVRKAFSSWWQAQKRNPLFARAWVRLIIFPLSVITTFGAVAGLYEEIAEIYARPRMRWPYTTPQTALSPQDVIGILLLLGSLLLFFRIVQLFDPFFFGRSPVMGIFAKILAVGHVLCAMTFMVFLSFHETPPALELLIWCMVIGWLWLMAALAYLTGDAYWTGLRFLGTKQNQSQS